jgi:hypothetical protein
MKIGHDSATPQLVVLLQAVSKNRLDLELASFDDTQIRRAVSMGLGPILFRSTMQNPRARRSSFWPLLRAADLAARVLATERVEAMVEIIDNCQKPVTLLKGISVSDQHYPEPHWRPMRDIDLLVEDDAIGEVEVMLGKLGYRQRSNVSASFYDTHHHSAPFVHAQKGIWVEVHRRLFPLRGRTGRDAVFSPQQVKSQLIASEFQGKRVFRLCNELQIVYMASHWAGTFDLVSGAVVFLDMIFLLMNCGQRLDWDRILKWVIGSTTATHLYLLLRYLIKYNIVDIAPELLDKIGRERRVLNELDVKIIHRVIDRYLISGKDFGRILTQRNLSIIWSTLLSRQGGSRKLFILPFSLLMPYSLRTRFQF